MTTSDLYSQPIEEIEELPEWMLNPEKKDSVDRAENAFVLNALRELATINGMTIQEIQAESSPVKNRYIAEAAVKAIEILSKNSNLFERTQMRLALKIMKANAHIVDDEEDFEGMLLKRLGEAKGKGTISEIKYTLQVIDMLETWGMNVDDFFTTNLAFSKFSRCIPVLRTKSDAIEAAKKYFREHTTSDKEPKKEQIEAQEREMDELQKDFTKALETAIKLTNDKSVEVTGEHGVKAALVKAINTDENGEKKQKTYEKAIVSKAYMNTSVVYFFSIHQNYEHMIDRKLGSHFDIQMSDMREIEDEVKNILNEGDDVE